jgi:hypothetical protein
MSNNSSSSFFALPSELRTKIYEDILHGIERLTLRSLNPYRGFIISCKDFKKEFEYEWAKAFNAFVPNVVSDTTLLPRPVNAFGDAKHLIHMVSNDSDAFISEAMNQAHVTFTSVYSIISLRLDRSFGPPSPKPRDFYHSDQYAFLRSMNIPMQRLSELLRLSHGSVSVPKQYQLHHPVQVRKDFWPPRITLERTTYLTKSVELRS